MGQPGQISIRVTHHDIDIAKNGYSNGKDIDLTTIAHQGVFSLQVEIESGSDSTSTTITYYTSNDGVNFVAGATAIVTAVNVASGLDAHYWWS